MKVVFCAYRDWALKVLPTIEKHPRVSQVDHVKDNYELKVKLECDKSDLVIFCGWSDPPTEKMVNMGVPMVSEHPATSDRYSPGTPLQNQILDGIRYTKHRIVKVGFPELSPRQWSHEVDMDLSGNMDDILEQMEATSKVLFNQFLDSYPNITWNTWPEVPEKEQVPRRVPKESQVFWSEFGGLTARELYDRIRCLEDPYPNAYVEDETGRLYFHKVSFKETK